MVKYPNFGVIWALQGPCGPEYHRKVIKYTKLAEGQFDAAGAKEYTKTTKFTLNLVVFVHFRQNWPKYPL